MICQAFTLIHYQKYAVLVAIDVTYGHMNSNICDTSTFVSIFDDNRKHPS